MKYVLSRIVGTFIVFVLSVGIPFSAGGAEDLRVDAAADERAISDWLYGVNVASYAATYFMDLCTPKLRDAKVTVVRYGATNIERYNFQKNRLFDVVTRNNTCPPMSWRSFLRWTTNDLGAEPFLQISLYGHVAGNGLTTADADYDHVQTAAEIQDWVAAAGSGVKLWGIGNEPMISWKRKDYPTRYSDAAHGDQVLNSNMSLSYTHGRFATLAAAVKASNPDARVLGPTEANWWLYWLNDYSPYCPVTAPNGPAVPDDPGWQVMTAAGNTWNHAVYPDRGGDPDVVGWETDTNRVLCRFALTMREREQSGGTRLADFLDVHRYINCFNDRDAIQETRGYWDPDYGSQDNETGRMGTKTKLLQRMRNIVDAYYPGTELSFSEYDYFYWNGHPDLPQVAAVGQMDVLGAFAEAGVKLACNWYIGEPNQSGAGYHHASDSAKQALFNERGEPNPKYWAFRLMSHHFRGTAVRASASDPSAFSVHAARRSNDLVIVAAYKGEYDAGGAFLPGRPARSAGIVITNFNGTAVKKVLRFGLNDPYLIEMAPGTATLAGNTLTCSLEPLAIYAFILTTNGAVEPPPSYQHVNPARMDFGPYETGMSSNEETGVEYTIPIRISNARAMPSAWSVSKNVSWLHVQGATCGTARVTDLVYLTVDRNGLAVGAYSTTVSVTTAEGIVQVPVTMDVIPGEAGGEKRICDFETGSIAHEWNEREPYSVAWCDSHGGPEDRDAPYVYTLSLDPNEKPRHGNTAALKVVFDRRNGDTDSGRLYLPLLTSGHRSIVYDEEGRPVATNKATGNWAGYDSLQVDIKTHTADSPNGKTRFLLTISDAAGHKGKPDLGGAHYGDLIELADDTWQTLIIPLTNSFYDWRWPEAQNGSPATVDFSNITGIELVPWQGAEDKSGVIYMDNWRVVTADVADNRRPVAVVTQAILRAQTGQDIPLFGDQSHDLDGSIASYRWIPSANLSNPDAANPVFNTTVPGTYIFDLVVTDNQGSESRNAAQVVIRVIPALVGTAIELYRDPELTDRISCVASNALDVYVKLVCSAGGSSTEADLVMAAVSGRDPCTGDPHNHCDDISLPLLETAADSRIFTGHLRLAPFSREAQGELGISEGETGTVVVAGVQTSFVMGPQRYGWERVVDHLEDRTEAFNDLEGVWFNYDDHTTNNLSVCTNAVVIGGAHAGSDKAMWARAVLGRGTGPAEEVYAGIGTQLRPYYASNAVLDLSAVSGVRGISFWLKGNGNMLDIVIGSQAITNYDNYVYRIEHTPASWRKYIIPFTAFGQLGWSPVGVSRDTTLSRANAVNFHFPSKLDGETNEIWVDDLSVFGGNVSYSPNPVYHKDNVNCFEGAGPLLANPGFDGPGATNWALSGNATNENWGNWMIVFENWSSTSGLFEQTVSNIAPGRAYEFTAAAQKAASFTGQVSMALAWYNGETLLGTDSTNVTARISASEWSRVGTGPRTAPALATKVIARVTEAGVAPPYADNCCKFDDAQLTDGRQPDNDWVSDWIPNLTLSWDTNAAEGLRCARLHTTSTNWVGGMILPPYDTANKMTNLAEYAGLALKARRAGDAIPTGHLLPRIRVGLATGESVNARTRWHSVGAATWGDFLLLPTNDFYTAETVDNTDPATRVPWTGDWSRIRMTVIEYGPTQPEGTNTPCDILLDDFRPFGWTPPGPWKRLTASVEYLAPPRYDAQGLPVYYIGGTMEYRLMLENEGTLAYSDLWVQAIQEYHETTTNTTRGQALPGASTRHWTSVDVAAGGRVTLDDSFYLPYRTRCGLNQTHVIIREAGLEVLNVDVVGRWRAPPEFSGYDPEAEGFGLRPFLWLDDGGGAGRAFVLPTEPGLKYVADYTDSLNAGEICWIPFANASAGMWIETNEAAATHGFVDDETAGTSGGSPPNGHRYYRIRMSVP